VDKILDWLPAARQPWLVRYGITTVVMAICCALQLELAANFGLPGMSVLLVAIFACSLAFDRSVGFYATFLATVSSYFVFREWLPNVLVPSLGVFCVLAIALTFVGEALRLSLERAVTAENEKDLLLRELSHRTQNNLMLTAAILHLESRSTGSPEVKVALEKTGARIGVLSDAHRLLEHTGTGSVDLRDYFRRICGQIEKIVGGRQTIQCDAEPIEVSAEKAVALGLIANELITNALKYAFDEGERGKVTVSVFRKEPDSTELIVSDNGRGNHTPSTAGIGTRLIDMMVQQNRGRIVRKNTHPGFSVHVILPV
jgi:two-component sensor histidine kinase